MDHLPVTVVGGHLGDVGFINATYVPIISHPDQILRDYPLWLVRERSSVVCEGSRLQFALAIVENFRGSVMGFEN